MDILTIDEWIKRSYPPPQDDGNADWNFYQQWGYEQWLIKRFHYNLEQLRILSRKDYDTYLLAAKVEEAGGAMKLFTGKPLVRAKHIVSMYMCSSMPKGTIGIALWQQDDEWFCIWPKYKGSPWPQIRCLMRENEIEFIGMNFTDEQTLLDMQPTDRVAHSYMLENHIADIPGIGVKYVKRSYSGGVSRQCGTLIVVDAIPGKTVAWKRKPNAPEERLYNITNEQFEDIKILR